jgi:hypothetical protein
MDACLGLHERKCALGGIKFVAAASSLLLSSVLDSCLRSPAPPTCPLTVYCAPQRKHRPGPREIRPSPERALPAP